jgi:hypothetical protein
MSVHLQNVLAPHPHIFGNSAAPYSQQIYQYCKKAGMKVSPAMNHTSYGQYDCKEWMSFEKKKSKLGIVWEQNEEFIGPFQNIVQLRGELINFMTRLNMKMIMNNYNISQKLKSAYYELTEFDQNQSKSWMLEIVNFIKNYSSELITEMDDDDDFIDCAKDTVDNLDNYILRLQMAGLIIPKECAQDVVSIAPLQFSDLIVDFTKTIVKENGTKEKIDKESREFVGDLGLDHLSWYHSVSLFIIYFSTFSNHSFVLSSR